MIATHQATFGTHINVAAWQFDPEAEYIPKWVANIFTPTEDKDVWRAASGVKSRTGEWAICAVDSLKTTLMPDEEFQRCFRPLVPT